MKFFDLMKRAANEAGLELTELQYEQFIKYMRLLQEWNEKINLTAITDDEEVIKKHFIDCIKAFKSDAIKNAKAIIDEREDYINDRLDSAEEATDKARMIAIENERALNRAKEEGKAITEAHKKKAEKVYNEIVEDAKSEANLIIERARVEIDREREKVEYSLKKEAIDLALELSKKVIEKNIDEEKNKKLIDEFISEVGN